MVKSAGRRVRRDQGACPLRDQPCESKRGRPPSPVGRLVVPSTCLTDGHKQSPRINQDRFTHPTGARHPSSAPYVRHHPVGWSSGRWPWLGLSARPVCRRGQLTRSGSRPVVGIRPTLGRQALTSLPHRGYQESWPMRASSHLDGCCGNDPFRGSVAPPPPSAERGIQNSCPNSTHSRRIHKVPRLSPWDIYSATLASRRPVQAREVSTLLDAK
jgi:hypothetical protein